MNLPDYVRVDSPIFGDDLLAHPQVIQGDFMDVRLELPEDHPSVIDVMEDAGIPYDQVELIDLVHLSDVRTMDGEKFVSSSWYRGVLQEREDVLRRQQEARIEEKRLEYAAGKKTNFPALDWRRRS